MEIKFRAWDKRKKRFITDPIEFELELISLDIKVSNLYIGFVNEYFEYFDIQQYTGQKDKNGKEIYVGDIVEAEYGDFWRVIFNENNSCYCLQNLSVKYNSYFDDYIKSNTLAVIGNIYERHELTIKLLN